MPPRLAPFLIVALLLRLPAVLWARGYEFADHQFQYVEPAYHLAFDASWWRPWEYERGVRSWVYPGFLAALLRGVDALGVHEPAARMVAVRGVHALISLLPLLCLWHLVSRWRPVPRPRLVLAVAAVSGLFVYTGVQTNGPMWAAQWSVCGVLLAMGPRLAHAFWAGVAVGLAFTGRFQDALFAPVLVAYLLAAQRIRAAAGLAAGFALMVLAQGLLDLGTWGAFLHSAIAYVRVNVFEGKAAEFGHSPAWFYVMVLAAVTPLIPFVRTSLAAAAGGMRVYPLLALCAATYLVGHSLLERKATRFVLPALMLWTVVVAAGAGAGAHRPQSPWARAHGVWLLLLHAMCGAFLSVHYFHRSPVEAARMLDARADFQDRLILVSSAGTAQVGIGGYYYLNRRDLRVDVVRPERLAAWLTHLEGPHVYAMCERVPLSAASLPANWSLYEVGVFREWPDKERKRRFVYRLVRGP